MKKKESIESFIGVVELVREATLRKSIPFSFSYKLRNSILFSFSFSFFVKIKKYLFISQFSLIIIYVSINPTPNFTANFIIFLLAC